VASPKSSEKTQELVERLRSYLDAAPRGTAAGLAKERELPKLKEKELGSHLNIQHYQNEC